MTTTTTPTPTSGAADLRTAAQAVVDRWDTPLWKDVPATAEYIGRLRAALAAAQATAAQPGVVYAELPAPNYPKSGGFPGTFAEAQMRAFADATHTLRASHGQAPASTSGDFIRRTNEDYAAWCATKYTPEFNSKGPDLHGLWAWQEQQRRMDDLLRQAPAQLTQPASKEQPNDR